MKSPVPFRPGSEYALAAILSWLVPGAGHWLLGQRVRGVLLGSLLIGLFWWGEIQAGGYAVTRKEHWIFFCGQVGNGLSALIADRLQWADVEPAPGDLRAAGFGAQKAIDRRIPPGLSSGILLTTISGLLNVLLILHVLDPRSWDPEARSSPREAPVGGPAPGGGGTPAEGASAAPGGRR